MVYYYWSAILPRGKMLLQNTHLSQLNLNILSAAQADNFCLKFNFVKNQCDFAGVRTKLSDLLTLTRGLRSTDALVNKLNTLQKGVGKGSAQAYINQLIDDAWLLIIEPVPPNLIKSYVRMFDPVADEGPTGSMMSHVSRGFNGHGIGFRGDTRSYAEFQAKGFTARFAEPPGDAFHVPEVHGTIAAKEMAFDKGSRDFANQTGVCIARNIVGSMKFMGARRDDNDAVTSTRGWIYAVKIEEGCDTEQMQRDKVIAINNNTVLWRAGEKAVRQIKKFKFVASCQFEVDNPYSTRSDVTTFQYRRLSDWHFHWSGNASVKKYLNKIFEKVPLNVWQNFTSTDDWANEK